MYNYTNYTRNCIITEGNTVVIHTLQYNYARKCIIIKEIM
jgi:hypothetical protein